MIQFVHISITIILKSIDDISVLSSLQFLACLQNWKQQTDIINQFDKETSC